MRLTKQQIIEETRVEYAGGSKRGIAALQHTDRGVCQYLSKPSMMRCAVGRCMTDDALGIYGDSVENIVGLDGDMQRDNSCLDLNLKEEYRGHDIAFWEDLQSYHDDNRLYDGTCESLDRNDKAVENLLKNWKDK